MSVPIPAMPTPTSQPSIDVVFPVMGREVPLDHAYLLFSALSARLPELHDAPGIGVFALQGRPTGSERLDVQRGSLRVRCPADAFGKLLPLAGKELLLGGAKVRVGVPTARPLVPSAHLHARIVTIKGFTEAEPFRDAVERQLTALGVVGAVEIGRRRVVMVARDRIVGFELDVGSLSEEHSVALQERGLGGRRHMGCGLFLPRPSREA